MSAHHDHEIETQCPHCGRRNELHAQTDNEPTVAPHEGAVSLCWSCHKASIFTAEITLRLPTDEELAEIQAHPEFKRLMAARLEVYTPGQAIDLLRNYGP